MQNAAMRIRTIVPVIVELIVVLIWGMQIRPASAQSETTPNRPPLSGIVAISAEDAGSCALTANGGVECWDDYEGASNILRVSDAVILDSGGFHSCVITKSGEIKCWGLNHNGELGDGTTEQSDPIAVNVEGLPGKATALAVGFDHTCAIVDRDVLCWGGNFFGQLGDGTATDRSQPTQVEGLPTDTVAIGAGMYNTCALLGDGSVWCWGEETEYQSLSDGSVIKSYAPVKIDGLPNDILSVDIGTQHTCALATTGIVWCWGYNADGQLGDGSTESSDAPVQVKGLSGVVTSLSVGWDHACALTNGKVACWGDNRAGQLGDGSNTDHSIPVNVIGLSETVIDIATGLDHTCALLESGRVGCWGENASGELGSGIETVSYVPVDVIGLQSGVSGLFAEVNNTCSISDSTLQCWGANDYGKVGDGTDIDRSRPVAVQGLAGKVGSWATGWSHTCIVANGGVQCWGSSVQGQLGNDDRSADNLAPVQVSGLAGSVNTVVAGSDHTCALTDQGAVWCWGGNTSGEVGNGTTEDQLAPVQVSGLDSEVIALAAGSSHTCAARGDGVFCWGENRYGELGDGSTENRFTPVKVEGIGSGVIALSAAEWYSCALINDGTMKCWGANYSGQLGNGSRTDSLTPVRVENLPGKVIALASGDSHNCALIDNGSVVCWGGNFFGQLGDGTAEDKLSPVQVSGLNNGVIGLTAGDYHTCALTTRGAKCWGSNSDGQLGNGVDADSKTPLTVVLGPRNVEETEGFRASGPLVPEITTYIPTPLDVSTKPSVLGTNLFLAAFLMLPFAVAAEIFTRVLSEHEEALRRRVRVVDWVAQMQSKLEAATGSRLRRPGLRDVVKILGIIFFYGLVFSLLDRTWNPFTVKGLILLVSMMIAYGVVGIADDIIQWRAIRRWGLEADLRVRPTNFLLAAFSTTASRLFTLIPGMMFGTPEALHTDESQFDELKQRSLLRLSATTLTTIGLIVWMPTVLTGLLQKLNLAEGLKNAIGGVEAFLLVVFAVALENLFVQMLGMPGSLGHSLKQRTRWGWLVALLAVAFLFYHTLINPRGELAAAIREANVLVFFGIAVTFMLIAFGLQFYLGRRERAKPVIKTPSPRIESGPLTGSVQIERQAPVSTPATPPVAVVDVQKTLIVVPIDECKQCPVCGELIKAEARLCRFCRATFTVSIKGYCAECHQVVAANEGGNCVVCGKELSDIHVESQLLKAPAVIPMRAIAYEPPHVEAPKSKEDGSVKQCPACGQTIKAEALICRFCRARFEVRERGYCLADHAVVDVKDGKCVQCGDEARDVHMESKLVGETALSVPPASPSRASAIAVPVAAEQVTAADASQVPAAHTPFWQIYLSPKGRVGRLTFFVKGILPVLALLGLTFYVLITMMDSVNTSPASGAVGVLMSIGMIVLMVVMLFLCWVLVVLIIKRLHDLGRSGWNILLWLIPLAGQFINLWNWIEFLFVAGAAGPNKFGNRAD